MCDISSLILSLGELELSTLVQPSQYLFEGLMVRQAMPSARAEEFGC